MKHFFKYEFGYLNIDKHGLYLTNTGNWSETKGLKERNTDTPKYNFRRFRILIYLIISLGTLAFTIIGLLFQDMPSFKTLIFVALISFMIYFLYKYLTPELGPQFFIPMDKIESLKEVEKDLYITFRNAQDKSETFRVKNIQNYNIIRFKEAMVSD